MSVFGVLLTDFGVVWCGLIGDCCCVKYATFGCLFGD
jgi:hypothetical protein